MSKRIEQRVKDKLKTISQESAVPFNALLDTLFLERFLVRIGKSKYSKELIFKGGMCLANIIELGRETKDIDFLLKTTKVSTKKVEEIMGSIAKTEIEDGFLFSVKNVSELSLEHKKYPGYRITVHGTLHQIRNTVSIDIGVGDVVRPKAIHIELMQSNGPIFEEGISLQSYPPEYIFSEKVEAIVHFAELNSRMKDFYDCYHLIESGVLDLKALKAAITETFENRETVIKALDRFSPSFEARWKAFLNKNGLNSIDLEKIRVSINNVLESFHE